METAVFSVGDIVRHKASDETGVVASINGVRRCTKHPLMSAIHIIGGSDECEWVFEFDGTYDVSIGLANTAEDVPEGLLVLDEET